MPTIRAALNILVFCLLLLAMSSVWQPVHAQSRTVEQYQIDNLQSAVDKMSTYGSRLDHLEDTVEELKNDANESKWWSRFIAGALIAAVIERILRSAKILKPSDRGIGPLG